MQIPRRNPQPTVGVGVGDGEGADGPRGALSWEAKGRTQDGSGWELLGRHTGGELPPSRF